jgi:multidrug efflux pump subunit AcrA (membrane-fusion protein)
LNLITLMGVGAALRMPIDIFPEIDIPVVGGVFSGKIARSAESINAQARTMKVEVDMPNADHRLVPGMYVNVAFSLPPRGLVEVPAAALVFRASGAQVARVNADGKIEFSSIRASAEDGRIIKPFLPSAGRNQP